MSERDELIEKIKKLIIELNYIQNSIETSNIPVYWYEYSLTELGIDLKKLTF